MKKSILISLLLVAFTAINAFAQNGTVRGTVIDSETGEKLMSVLVKCETAPGGGYSDLDGAFSFPLPAGTHTLSFTYQGMTKQQNNVVVNPNEVTVVNFTFTTNVNTISGGAIKIVAERTQTTITAIDVQRKKSVNVTDGIPSETITKAGASDAAQAAKLVPGISVQGNKYVFVRGLGDRYTKTILNGVIIPGLDPDRNTVQMDIFPSNILDNIIVYKTFTPDLPGDFTGGVVDINTKAFPSKRTQSISLGIGFNPAMHMNNDYISYKGGNFDWLGFDDGTRKLPVSKQLDLTSAQYDPSSNNPELTAITKSFNKTLAPEKQMNLPDFKMSYTLGDQINKDKKTFGYNLAFNYTKETTFYDSAYYGSFVKAQDFDDNELLLDKDASGPLSNQNIMWSVLAGGAYKVNSNRYTITAIHTQNGESRAALLKQEDYRENPSVIFKNNLEYTQRSVSNVLITGKHSLDSNKWNVEWKLSPTFSRMYEPDIKLTAFELTDDENPQYQINEPVGAEATRTYRYLSEWNHNAKIDVERKFNLWNKQESKLKFGMLETFKIRDFEVLNYQFRIQQGNKFVFSGDADELLEDQNIWTVNPDRSQDSGVYVTGNPEPANTFTAMQNIFGVYAMNELPLTRKFKLIYGARVEKADNYYTGTNQNKEQYIREKLLDELNVMPSLNVVYAVKEDFKKRTLMNVRASYSKTVARPSFKELSNAQIQDRISGRTFIGNEDLVQTNIDNIDFRWEYFGQMSQMVSASAFYKKFENPIELVAYNASNPNNFQPRNVGNASLYGIELEIRKRIAFLSDTLMKTVLGANSTFVKSSVEMNPAEREARVNTARTGETVGTHRDMVGQSPYIINTYLTYTHYKSKFDATLTYNVQGPRLSIVGVGRNPDVYEMPFHSLTMRVAKEMGRDDRCQLSFTAQNVLNSTRLLVYKSYGAKDQVFSRLLPQTKYSIGFRYNIIPKKKEETK